MPRSGDRTSRRRNPTDFGAGRFLVEGAVGEGGTARVFRATDTRTARTVAVKMLRPSLVGQAEVVARFEVEADLLASFDHPNILPLIDSGRTDDGVPWFATTFAERGSLANLMLATSRLRRTDVLGYAAEILDALHYLHARGVVHRDVKPENILVDHDDVAILCDFGIARTPVRRATLSGDAMGTPAYMPPEQYRDPGRVTHRADLYGVGVTLFTALTGQTGMLLLVDHLRPDALATLPAAVVGLVARATSPLPRDRFASAREMSLEVADALEALGEGDA